MLYHRFQFNIRYIISVIVSFDITKLSVYKYEAPRVKKTNCLMCLHKNAAALILINAAAQNLQLIKSNNFAPLLICVDRRTD